jgi:HTH-type transcriptional regulator/antitoxin HigA
MDYKVIKTEDDYKLALKRLEVIFDTEPGTPEGEELDLLSLLIDNYEKIHYPIGLPDPFRQMF